MRTGIKAVVWRVNSSFPRHISLLFSLMVNLKAFKKKEPVPGVQMVERERKRKRAKEREKNEGRLGKLPSFFPALSLALFAI